MTIEHSLPILTRVATQARNPDPAQLAAIRSTSPRLLISGRSGTGKTTVLTERFARLAAGPLPPERILVVERFEADADRLRPRLEARLDKPWEELAVHGMFGLAQRLIAMAEPIPARSTDLPLLGAADRLALLADSIDRLTFDAHDLGRDPLVLLSSLIARIDMLELNMIDLTRFGVWAAALESPADRERELEFHAVWTEHDRLLSQSGALSGPAAVMDAARLLQEDVALRELAQLAFDHVIAPGIEDFEPAHLRLLELIADGPSDLTVLTDPMQGHVRSGGEWAAAVQQLELTLGEFERIDLETIHRGGGNATVATNAILGIQPPQPNGEGTTAEFWQATSSRAEAQAVAADIERLVMREGVDPSEIAVIVSSVARDAPAIEVALEERALPNRVQGGQAFLQRAEIRDLLAWLRLLIEPSDGAAVIRALARGPIGLSSADIARCSTIARKRRLDLVSALAAATESPQVPPEARERIEYFLRLHALATRAIDELRPDLFIHRLIERLGLRATLAYAASPQSAERLRALATFSEIAAAHVRRDPQATARDFARHITAIARSGVGDLGVPLPDGGTAAVEVLAMEATRGREWEHVFIVGLDAGSLPAALSRSLEGPPIGLAGASGGDRSGEARSEALAHLLSRSVTRATNRVVLCHPRTGRRGDALHPANLVEAARSAVGAEWIERETELFAPGESLQATYRIMRDELLEVVETTGRKMLELRLDTGDDIDRAVVRFLELLKLSALNARPDGHAVADSLAALNERLRAIASDSQREGLAESPLDSYVVEVDRGERERDIAINRRREPSLEAFLPRRGDGVALSAGDIETYITCPLKYKFSRVMRVPQEPTVAQRFGIVVHQVLERWHRQSGGSESDLLALLDQSWRRSGLGDGERERQLKSKARDALVRYHAADSARTAETIWLERPFTFRIGPHILRGRVDRVDRLADGGFELIDYKTSFPKTPDQLRDDIQLTLYAIGARDAWMLDASTRSYWYVLDGDRVEVPGEIDRDEIESTVTSVAEGILGQGFEPNPSFSACSVCDWRLACPAAESG